MTILTGRSTAALSLSLTAFTTQEPRAHATVLNALWQQFLDNDAVLDGQVAQLIGTVNSLLQTNQLQAQQIVLLYDEMSLLRDQVRALGGSGSGGNSSAITVDFTATGNIGGITLTATAATTNAGASLVAYEWSLGDGSTATGSTVQRTYAAAGSYSVTLLVRDSSGASKSITKNVFVAPPAAIALTQVDGTGNGPNLFRNTGAWSEDTGGESPGGTPIYIQHSSVNAPLLVRGIVPNLGSATVQARAYVRVNLQRAVNGQHQDQYFYETPGFKVSYKRRDGLWEDLTSRVHPLDTLNPVLFVIDTPIANFADTLPLTGLFDVKIEGVPWGLGSVSDATLYLATMI